MKIFFKNKNKSFLVNSRDLSARSLDLKRLFEGPNIGTTVNIGIDGSTTSFGASWFVEPSEPSLLMLMRDTSETGESFLEKVFPFLQQIFEGVVVDTATYERTPEDFDSDTLAMKIMKQTEASVKNFLANSFYINISHPFNVFDVFPGSWRAFMVSTDLVNNPGKKDKRENSLAILKKCDLSPEFWLHELDNMSGHSYDCIEALAIGVYGAHFIRTGPFIRTYRNFTRRRPLYTVGFFSEASVLPQIITSLHEILGKSSLCMYVPNDYHSVFENLYALDSDDKFGLLITQSSCQIRPYLEHLHCLHPKNPEDVLVSLTLRHNEECLKAIARIERELGSTSFAI